MGHDSDHKSHLPIPRQNQEPETADVTTEEVRRAGTHSADAIAKPADVVPPQLHSNVVDGMARHYGLLTVDLDAIDRVEESAIRLLPREFCESRTIFPISIAGSTIIIACADPGNVSTIDDIRFKTGLDVEVMVASEEAIMRALAYHYTLYTGDDVRDEIDEHMKEMAGEIEVEVASDKDENIHDLERVSQAEPVVKLVNLLLVDALRRGASDIHIEPYDKTLRIRFRIDGELREIMCPPVRLARAVVSRVKVMSALDISERRLPQDGRMKISISGKDCTVRVSVAPFASGEKAVLRLLDTANLQTDMTRLGFEVEELAVLREAIARPYGMVLVTGPTGSGKTTTLYSALAELNRVTKNISTAEDPIEYQLPSINQMQINDAIGLNFAHALRTFLRQDPDIIMVGEIRDFETAEIAVKAAQTGHLVLSTLHTNDAPSAITRLTNMGTEAFLIADTLNLVVAQRLVRRVCAHCRKPYQYNEVLCKNAGMGEKEYESATMMKGVGCPKCNGTGLKGRTAIYEVLPIDDMLRDAITEGRSGSELKRIAVNAGMCTLRRSALKKCARGLISLDEALRVTHQD